MLQSIPCLLRGELTSLPQYWEQRHEFGPLIHDDEVHGTFQLGLLAGEVLKHPAFGRLAGLKQLGCCYKVFPEANHNRYQHSRGVAYLSGRWAAHLAKQQQREGAGLHPQHTQLSPLELELIELAGLCHDFGHGPFSHVFEASVVKSLGISGWVHESLSGLLLKHVLADVFWQAGLLTEAELLLQPAAGHNEQQQQSDGWALLSRLHGAVTDLIGGADKAVSGCWMHKPFVLQIVASTLDADKIDYLMRDMIRTGGMQLEGLQELAQHTGDCQQYHLPLQRQRHLNFAALIDSSRLVDGRICFAAADQPLVQQLIRARRLMHEHVYQRADVKGFELMLAATLQATAHCLDLDWLRQHAHLASQGFAQEQAFVDYFCGLTDSLLDEARRRALHNPHGDARRQTALLTVRAYDQGRSYPCVEEDDPEGVMAARVTAPAAEQAILDILSDRSSGASSSGDAADSRGGSSGSSDGSNGSSTLGVLLPGDVKVVYVKFDHCMGDKDPLKDLQLWQEGPDGAISTATGSWSADSRPSSFLTRKVRVYLTKQCSPTEQVKHTLSLQLALQTVVQETAAAAAKGAAAGNSLASAAALPAAAAVSTGPEQEEGEEEEEEEMQAELLSLTPAPAAGHMPQAGFNTPLHSHLLYSQMSSQEMALTQQQALTQRAAAAGAAAAAAADAGGMSPIRRFPGYSNGSSPGRVTPQQQQQSKQQQERHCQQQQLLLPFCQACDGSTQAAATVLPAGSTSLDTAVSVAAAAAAGSDRRVPVAVAKAAWEEIGLRPDGSKKAAGKRPHKAGAATHAKRAAEPGPGAGRHTRQKAGGAS